MNKNSRVMIRRLRLLSLAILLVACAGLELQPVTAQNSFFPQYPTTWSIVASYPIPGKASGLAWDGTYIYFGMYWSNGNQVYKFDPSAGTYTLQCTGTFSESYGLTYKSPNLVNIIQPTNSSQPAQINEFTMSGTPVGTINMPVHYMSGVAYDAGSYWVCTYYPDPGTVYHVNSSGGVISQFTPPNNQPWDICLQGTDLWIADYYGDMLYKVTETGTLLESHASQGLKPSGVVFDGTYLWYCDGEVGQNSTLYKVDLNGSGTPVINVPVTSHDYGTVTVGNSSTWNCQVQNTGTANLVINGIGIPGGQPISTTFITPATLTPGSSVNIPLTYSPVTGGTLNTQVSINSNDPIHPAVDVTLTGNAVIAGPHIKIQTTSHDWQERRKNAYSRWYLEVENDGDQTLTITALNMSDPHFIIDAGVTLPLNIPTLQTVQIGIWFHPTGAGQDTGTLSIVSNDPLQNPFTIGLTGTCIDILYPMGTSLWTYTINDSYDNSPKSIRSIPDITGDTIDDVIIGSEDDYVRCFNGNASVTADVLWETYIYAGAVYQQNAIAIIDDIDNDGYKDVIVGTAWGDRSVIALSGKTGLQLWKHDTHEYGGGGWVYQVDTRYDYNNDGFPDVLAAVGDDGSNTGPHRVYCLDGKTGHLIWSRSTQGAAFSVTGVEDFTGDGKPDVVAGATDANQTHGLVFGMDGVDGSIQWTFHTSGSSTWALMQIDDVTGDGIKDVAAGDFSGHIYFLNAATGPQVKMLQVGSDIILRFEDMGDVNSDGHPDILVGHSGPMGIIVDGFKDTFLWQKPLADQSWNVTNMGDITWDGVNDAAIGTLYSDNNAYFLNGMNGNQLAVVPQANPVDALSSIPDIVGDGSRELMVGGRDGSVFCLSGGYDSATVSIHEKKSGALSVKIYPNPCTDGFNVFLDIPVDSDVKISLGDITGRTLCTRNIPGESPGPHTYYFDRNAIHIGMNGEGIGIITVETRQGIFHGKIVFRE
jgi:hypothetical protein